MKTSENLWFSDIFRGIERASGMKWAKPFHIIELLVVKDEAKMKKCC